MPPQARPAHEPRYGWVMVAVAGLFMGVGSGSIGAMAVFLRPLTVEFDWLRGETAFAYLAATTAMGLGGIVMGHLSDRHSARPIVLGGAVMLGAAYVLLSRQSALWQLYLFYVVLGGLGTAGFDAPLLTNLGAWFTRNKGLAIGLATALRSLGQGLVPFVAGLMIAAGGWRLSYLALGLFALLVMGPLALLVRTPPRLREAGAGAGAAPASAGEPDFPVPPRFVLPWLMAAPVFCCITMATPLVHVAALAEDRGLSTEGAAGVLLVLFTAAFFGRIFFGRLADHVGGLRAYMLASALQTALLFWFTRLHTAPAFYVLAVLFGFGYSGVMTCIVICVREMIPLRIRGAWQGVVLLTAWTGMGLGGWQGGFFYDLTGSYTAPFALAVLSGLINLGLLAGLWLTVSRRTAAHAGALAD